LTALKDYGASYTAWLFQSALPLWSSAGVDAEHGAFREALAPDGAPVAASHRARVQGRQSFVFAHAGKLGWNGPWTKSAGIGLACLERHYRRPDGLYATLTGPDMAVTDATAMTYDQAFALLAAAALHEQNLGPGEDYALTLMSRIEALRRHPGGGFVESDGRFLSNPHMHLLEAALGWIEAGGSSYWTGIAEEIVTLALDRFIDPEKKVLREFFDADWWPAGGDAGLVVEPGHQFEWAWLLERWSRLRADVRAHDSALALFAAGTRGVDRTRNVAVDETGPDLRIRRATARLWPQTERLKAALLLGEDNEARAAAAGLWQYLDTPRPGLWRDKMREDGSFVEEPAPASSLYHIICAVASLKAWDKKQ
jgi:mannose-1-phosphate guanylyltransferase/mannose-6-phosphate isomerase